MAVRGRSNRVRFSHPPQSSLRDHAYDEIREAIIAGTLSPGDRIKERDVSLQMGISTTPVKEALRRLEQEGFVVSLPRRGAVVSSIALIALEEIVQIRAALEALAANFATKRMSQEARDAMSAHLGTMERLTRNGPIDRLVAANTAFHQMIREGSENGFIKNFVASLEPFDLSVRRQALADPEEAMRGYSEHKAIAAAIVAGDADRAASLMSAHIMRTIRFVVDRSSNRWK